MDKVYNRSVDIYTIDIKYGEGAEVTPTFEDLLRDPVLVDGDFRVKGKLISFRILEDTESYIVGLVETNRSDNIPPVKRRAEQRIESMELPEGDGLAFGNVFYYDIRRKVILYEVSKNGSILNHFVDYIYRKLVHLRRNYSIRTNVVLTADQNARLQRMGRKTKIELEIAHPTRIAEDQVANSGTFGFLFDKGAVLDSTKLRLSFSVDARHGESLNSREVDETIREIEQQIRLEQAEIEHLKVHGYVDDREDDKIQVIDLVTERLKGTIQLREPRVAMNLLEGQRLGQIKLLYQRIEDELIRIFDR